MKILLTLILLISQAYAVVDVNVRNKDLKLVKVSLDERQFPAGNILETEQFKIVLGESNDPIDLSSSEISEEDKLRATTTLYHLITAKNYFVNELGATHVDNMGKITVRISMSKPFNEFYHFVKDSKVKEANNAVTVPANGKKIMPGVEAWGTEVWFRPAVKEKIDNVVYQTGKALDQSDVGTAVTTTVVSQTIDEAVQNIAWSGSLSSVDYIGQLSRLMIVAGIVQVVPKFLMLAASPLKTEAFLDTAMIPEVSYHEFAHIAFSDEISIRRSTPLNEGIANYFAAVINKNSKIASKNGEYSKNISSYNGDSKVRYSSMLETDKASHANFVFSFLWSLRTRFGKEMENGSIQFDKLLFESRKHVTYAKNPIKDDLIPSLTNAASALYPGANARKIRLLILDQALKAGI